uniref:Uncharacterized protein n=1 Tax=Anguilla anguilla TaxID=7936 RepID=A0A0E9RXZ6_ANGAN
MLIGFRIESFFFDASSRLPTTQKMQKPPITIYFLICRLAVLVKFLLVF